MKRGKRALLLILTFLPFLLATLPFEPKEEVNTEEGLREEIEKITPMEEEILKELFIQKQEIINIESEILNLEVLIDKGEIDRKELIRNLEIIREDYNKGRESLSKVLLSFQKRGGADLFQLFLESKSIKDLLFHLNILREFSNGTKKLLTDLSDQEEEMETKKQEIEAVLSDIKTKKNQADEKREELRVAITLNEERLQSLKDERKLYETRINILEERLKELDETLKLFTEEFNKLLREGYFPDEMINIKVSLRGVSGAIKDDELNDLLKEFEVPEVELFFLDDDKIRIESKEYNLKLYGSFSVIEGTRLAFIGEEGSFYNLPLTQETIKSLMDKNYLIFDFKPILEGYEMKNVKTNDGEMIIFMKLF